MTPFFSWHRSEPLFLALGQEPELAAAAARYMRTVAPALPAIGISEACRRTLMAQVGGGGLIRGRAEAAASQLARWAAVRSSAHSSARSHARPPRRALCAPPPR